MLAATESLQPLEALTASTNRLYHNILAVGGLGMRSGPERRCNGISHDVFPRRRSALFCSDLDE